MGKEVFAFDPVSNIINPYKMGQVINYKATALMAVAFHYHNEKSLNTKFSPISHQPFTFFQISST